MNYTIILFAVGIIFGSLGGILFKIAGSRMADFEMSLKWIFNFILNPYVLSGFILYFIPGLIWIFLLKKYPLSFVQPILALTYVITPILAIVLLQEKIPIVRWVGIIIIIIGVFIISKTQ